MVSTNADTSKTVRALTTPLRSVYTVISARWRLRARCFSCHAASSRALHAVPASGSTTCVKQQSLKGI